MAANDGPGKDYSDDRESGTNMSMQGIGNKTNAVSVSNEFEASDQALKSYKNKLAGN